MENNKKPSLLRKLLGGESGESKYLKLSYSENYFGRVDENNNPHGYGEMKFINGAHYEGIFKDGYREGYGETTCKKGYLNIGNWKCDRIDSGFLVDDSGIYTILGSKKTGQIKCNEIQDNKIKERILEYQKNTPKDTPKDTPQNTVDLANCCSLGVFLQGFGQFFRFS